MLEYKSAYRLLSVLTIFAVSALTIQCNSAAQDNKNKETEKHEEVELAVAMGQLQTYTHKYTLAVEAENHELASFYLHEIEESVEGIAEDVPTYEGYDIAKLIGQYLEPEIEPTEEALESKNWEEVRKQTIKLVDTCNSCHEASDHGFVKITPGFNNNPFNQDFSTPK
jgi:hypothetical protein